MVIAERWWLRTRDTYKLLSVCRYKVTASLKLLNDSWSKQFRVNNTIRKNGLSTRHLLLLNVQIPQACSERNKQILIEQLYKK